MKIKKYRDLTLVDINDRQSLVIACDSSGGIGDKKHDLVKTPPDVLGFYITSVVLAEILSSGAKPVTIVNTLSVEMEETGSSIIEGIKRAIRPLSLSEDIIVTGSTEENFPVCQTGMGITAIGIIDLDKWETHKTNKGALAVVVGLPKVGDEVLMDKGNEILTIPLLLDLIKDSNIQEILPVGSKGILYEAEELGSTNNLKFVPDNKCSVNLQKSAGPATCAVVSIEERYFDTLKGNYPLPVNRIGKFKGLRI